MPGADACMGSQAYNVTFPTRDMTLRMTRRPFGGQRSTRARHGRVVFLVPIECGAVWSDAFLIGGGVNKNAMKVVLL